MSEKIQIILIAISLIILIIRCYDFFLRVEQLEKNQEVLRNAINKLSEEKDSDNRNTNEIT